MPRRKVADKWPFPADSPLDRAYAVAGNYRTALLEADPDRCAELDAKHMRLGQGRVVPQLSAHDLDDMLPAAAVADFCYVQTATIDVWVSRGLRYLDTREGRRFKLRDVLEYQAEVRRKRAAARSAG